MSFRILHQDPFLVAVDKPAGFHVHPPEDPTVHISQSVNCLAILRRQLDRFIYPVHRLDCATSGVLIFALDSESASKLATQFREREIQKTYYAVARGWVSDAEMIDRPLKSEDRQSELPSVTRIGCFARIEMPHSVGRYSSARYSLVRAEPETGRLHQIRRHLAGSGHPIVGDSVHGDGAHNRYFRNELKIPSLLLKAQSLKLRHPRTEEPLFLESRWTGKWHRVFDLFGICPTRYV